MIKPLFTYHPNGNIKKIQYKINNMFHREDYGPTNIHCYLDGSIKSKTYHHCDKLHNLYGPAKITYNIRQQITKMYWFYNDTFYSKEVREFMRQNKLNLEDMTQDQFNQMWFEIL